MVMAATVTFRDNLVYRGVALKVLLGHDAGLHDGG